MTTGYLLTLKKNHHLNRMIQPVIIVILIACLLVGVVVSKLKYLDDVEVFDIMDLNNLAPDRSIVIEKEADFKYNTNMGDMLNKCSEFREYKAVVTSEEQGGVINYQTCIDKEGREFKLIPADDLTDLSPTYTYQHLSGIKKMKPFAPHFIILEDVAVYGHGDIMTLDGTSHYLGTCRQFGAPGFDSINIKRNDVVGFIYEPVINLVTLWTENYLNAMLSFLPRYLSLLPILKKYPDIIIAKNMFRTRAQVYVEPILNYYGITPYRIKQDTNIADRKLNFMNIEYGKVYFMKTLIAPISTCKFMPKKAVTMIRTAVHSIYALNTSTPQTGIIISDRKDMEELYKRLTSSYGISNVMKYSTKLGSNPVLIYQSLEQTVRMFNQCKLFIAPHGAALANIMFMNPGATVIEIRVETPKSWYFSQLSSLVKVNYQTSWTDGSSTSTMVKFSIDDVLEKTSKVMNIMD